MNERATKANLYIEWFDSKITWSCPDEPIVNRKGPDSAGVASMSPFNTSWRGIDHNNLETSSCQYPFAHAFFIPLLTINRQISSLPHWQDSRPNQWNGEDLRLVQGEGSGPLNTSASPQTLFSDVVPFWSPEVTLPSTSTVLAETVVKGMSISPIYCPFYIYKSPLNTVNSQTCALWIRRSPQERLAVQTSPST